MGSDSPRRGHNPDSFARRTGPQFQLRPQWWNWGGLSRTLEQRFQRQGTTTVSPQGLVGLRNFWIDGFFASVSDNILLSFLTLFVLAYGATNGQIGILTAVGNLFGVVALFPGAAHADRTTSPKRLVLLSGGIAARAAIILLVIVPFFSPTATVAIWAVIGANAIRSFFGNYANPAWTGLVAELVPADRRDRYFADRNIAMGVAGMAALWAAGFVIPRLNEVAPHLGYQAVFLGALIFGALSTVAFSRIPVPKRTRVAVPRGAWRGMLDALRNHGDFGALLVGAVIWNFSVQAAAPFFNVFIVADLGGTAETVGLTAAVTTLFGLAGFLLFGRMGQKRGTFSVVRLTGLLIPIIPALWAVSNAIWHIYALSALTGILWAGYNLGNFNLLLEFVPDQFRSRGVALYQLVVFSSAVIGPITGGLLVDAFGYRGIFGFSAIGRMLGILIFLYLMAVSRRSRSE